MLSVIDRKVSLQKQESTIEIYIKSLTKVRKELFKYFKKQYIRNQTVRISIMKRIVSSCLNRLLKRDHVFSAYTNINLILCINEAELEKRFNKCQPILTESELHEIEIESLLPKKIDTYFKKMIEDTFELFECLKIEDSKNIKSSQERLGILKKDLKQYIQIRFFNSKWISKRFIKRIFEKFAFNNSSREIIVEDLLFCAKSVGLFDQFTLSLNRLVSTERDFELKNNHILTVQISSEIDRIIEGFIFFYEYISLFIKR